MWDLANVVALRQIDQVDDRFGRQEQELVQDLQQITSSSKAIWKCRKITQAVC